MLVADRFLATVLPAQGLRVVASKPPTWSKGLRHTFLPSNEAVAAEAKRLDQLGVTNYIALATYADPELGRVATNTLQLQCLWLDVDYKQYDSPEDALDDVRRLSAVIGSPTMQIQSGGGLHTYWVLRDPLDTAEWKPLADAFQATWQALEVHADPISADAARVLRIPGTHNHKYDPPREVQTLVHEDVTYTPSALLKAFATVAPLPAKPRASQHDIPSFQGDLPAALQVDNDDLSTGAGHKTSHIRPLIKQCLQLQYCVTHKATLAEPQWYAMLGLVRHVENGYGVAHAFSKGHPGYSETSTDDKLGQLEAGGIGPTTCAKFKSVNPAGCVGCGLSITSPIILGHEQAESVQPEVEVVEHTVTPEGEVVTVTHMRTPEVAIPQGFKYDGHVIYRILKDQETGMPRDEPIFSGLICPERLVVNERNNHTTEIQLYVQSKGQLPRRITVPAKALSDKRDISRELSGKGAIHMAKHAGHLLDMLHHMTQDMQSKRRDSAVAEQMGWQDDGSFVVGSTAHRPGGLGPLFDLPVPAGTKPTLRSYEPAGTLEAWKRTAEVYNHAGAEAYQFALLYGAAGVFLPLTKLSGVVLSLYSSSSGRGKSTAGYAALSWWGSPNGMKSQSKDTSNALFNKASRHKNLPVLMDEVTDKANWELEDLVYFMSQGREKESMTSDRVARPILPGWELPVISTSNNSIKSKLQSRRGDSQGLFARILEVSMELDFPREMGYGDKLLLRTGFVENYGQAGPMMAAYAMANRNKCQALMDMFAQQLDSVLGGDAGYRFWVASCAATLTVAVVARELGLVQYDIKALASWVGDMLRSQRSDVLTTAATSEDILARFLETNANRIIVAYPRQMGSAAPSTAIWPEDGLRGSQLVGRVEIVEHTLYLSLPSFAQFCNESGYDMSSFIRSAWGQVDESTDTRLLRQPAPTQVNLGRGSRTASARTRALAFNLLHPALREYAMGVDSKITEVTTPLRSVK